MTRIVLAAARALASIAALAPLAVSAQGAPPSQPQRGITRDQFVQRASEMAGRRFDAIDTGHTGTITRDQLRAWRQAHGHDQPGATPQ